MQGWHGAGWADDTIDRAPEPEPRPVRDINRYAIALALSPLLGIVFILFGVISSWPLDLVVWAGLIVLAILDARELRRAGYRVHAWWILLLTLVHLIHRKRRTGQSATLPWVWVACALAAFAVGLMTYDFDAELDAGDTAGTTSSLVGGPFVISGTP